MFKNRQFLLENLERITGEVAELKKTIILEFRPAPNGDNKGAWKNLQRAIKDLANKWDNVSSVEEIKRQRTQAA